MKLNHAQSGFSLIEALIAIAIMSIVASMAMPNMTIFTDGTAFKGAKAKVRSALVKARTIARTQSKCVTLTVTGQNITITTYSKSPPCTPPFPAPDSTFIETLDSRVIPTPFTTGNPLIFNTRGGTDYAGPSEISLQGLGKQERIKIYPLIGQIDEGY